MLIAVVTQQMLGGAEVYDKLTYIYLYAKLPIGKFVGARARPTDPYYIQSDAYRCTITLCA